MHYYHHPLSSNCRPVDITLALTGQEVERHFVDLAKGAHRQESFTKLNPNQKIPTLVDGAFCLWESAAIMQYLANKARRVDLWPQEPAQQADVSRWMVWNHGNFNPVVGMMQFEKLMKPLMFGTEPNEEYLSKKMAIYQKTASKLDEHLSNSAYFCGDHLTLADISIASVLTFAEPLGLPLQETPHLMRWRTALESTEGFKTCRPKL